MPWLLVPLTALGSLRGQLCWCDHDHAGGHGQVELLGEASRGPGHAGHVGDAGQASHTASRHHEHGGHTDHGAAGAQHADEATGSDCCAAEDCDCIDLRGTADRPRLATLSDARKSIDVGPSALPPTQFALRAVPQRFAHANRRQRVGRAHAPPIFLLNCTFLC